MKTAIWILMTINFSNNLTTTPFLTREACNGAAAFALQGLASEEGRARARGTGSGYIPQTGTAKVAKCYGPVEMEVGQ